MSKANILLCVTGHTIEPVRKEFGNRPHFFEEPLKNHAQLEAHFIYEEYRNLPNPMDYDGVIMTGSAAMLEEDLEWMKAAKSLINVCLTNDVPFLGVCFGHQVLGSVCGARVGPNPKGRKNGSAKVTVCDPARIFSNLPNSFYAQESHRDVILEDRSEFKIIAQAEHDDRHAIKVGSKAFGVQFHPEWNIDISKAYIHARREALGEEKFQSGIASLRESPVAQSILHEFAKCCGQNLWGAD